MCIRDRYIAVWVDEITETNKVVHYTAVHREYKLKTKSAKSSVMNAMTMSE